MWDCDKCGCMNILDLPNCPMCRSPRPSQDVPAAPASVTEGLAPLSVGQEQESQAPKSSKGKGGA